MAFNRKDHFHKKAKEDGYRSRAAYKIKELDKRFRLFKQGGRVLDLGAAPGGWLQVAAQKVGKRGTVVGIDRLSIPPLPYQQITILLGDLLEETIAEQALDLLGGPAHTVLCDMAPNISGIRFTDCVRSHELATLALDLACRCLAPGGAFVTKIFPGEDFESFLKEVKSVFRKVRTTRPEATRSSSSEVYVIATHFKGRKPPEPQKKEPSEGSEES